MDTAILGVECPDDFQKRRNIQRSIAIKKESKSHLQQNLQVIQFETRLNKVWLFKIELCGALFIYK